MSRRRGRSELTPVGSLVPRVLDDLGFGSAARVVRLAERWEEIVGPEVARHCRPDAFRGDVLHASVDSSVWCQELRLRAPRLLEALRRELGDDAPTDLFFHLG